MQDNSLDQVNIQDQVQLSFFDFKPQQLFAFDSSIEQYIPVLIFAIIALCLSIFILVIPFIINKMRPIRKKFTI